jgi:hypothetical protein
MYAYLSLASHEPFHEFGRLSLGRLFLHSLPLAASPPPTSPRCRPPHSLLLLSHSAPSSSMKLVFEIKTEPVTQARLSSPLSQYLLGGVDCNLRTLRGSCHHCLHCALPCTLLVDGISMDSEEDSPPAPVCYAPRSPQRDDHINSPRPSTTIHHSIPMPHQTAPQQFVDPLAADPIAPLHP